MDNGRSTVPSRRVSFAPKAKIREFQEQSYNWNGGPEEEGIDSGWEFEIPDLYSVRRMSDSYETDLKASSSPIASSSVQTNSTPKAQPETHRDVNVEPPAENKENIIKYARSINRNVLNRQTSATGPPYAQVDHSTQTSTQADYSTRVPTRIVDTLDASKYDKTVVNSPSRCNMDSGYFLVDHYDQESSPNVINQSTVQTQHGADYHAHTDSTNLMDIRNEQSEHTAHKVEAKIGQHDSSKCAHPPQGTPRYVREDSMAAFFKNTREKPLEIDPSPTLRFNKPGDELNDHKSPLNKTASDMSIQMELHSPTYKNIVSEFDTQLTPFKKESEFTIYNTEITPTNASRKSLEFSTTPPQVKSIDISKKVDPQSGGEYPTVASFSRSESYNRVHRYSHVTTPTKLRVVGTPTVDLRSSKKDFEYGIDYSQLEHPQFGAPHKSSAKTAERLALQYQNTLHPMDSLQKVPSHLRTPERESFISHASQSAYSQHYTPSMIPSQYETPKKRSSFREELLVKTPTQFREPSWSPQTLVDAKRVPGDNYEKGNEPQANSNRENTPQSKKLSQDDAKKMSEEVISSITTFSSIDGKNFIKEGQSSQEKTLRDDFFDQFNDVRENIMHERLPSSYYTTTLQERILAENLSQTSDASERLPGGSQIVPETTPALQKNDLGSSWKPLSNIPREKFQQSQQSRVPELSQKLSRSETLTARQQRFSQTKALYSHMLDSSRDIDYKQSSDEQQSLSSSRQPKKHLNVENILKSINVDLTEEFPYNFTRKNTAYYLPKVYECCNIEKLLLMTLLKLTFVENECQKLQEIVTQTRGSVKEQIRAMEQNPPPVFYEIYDHNHGEVREVKENIKNTHVFTVNEAEATVYMRHSNTLNNFHRSISQKIPTLRSDVPKLKTHLDTVLKKLKTAKELNDIIRGNVEETKRRIAARRAEQEAKKLELSKLCDRKHDYLRSLMDKNVSSEHDINDSSEIDKLKAELKHVQSCTDDVDKKYEKMKRFSLKRLRELRIAYDLVYVTLPWKIESCTKDFISMLYMGVLQLDSVREKNAPNKIKVSIRLTDRRSDLTVENHEIDDWSTIEKLGRENVSLLLSQVCKSYFNDSLFPYEFKRGMLLLEALWYNMKQVYFDLEVIKLRHEASVVISKDNSLGIKINYVSQATGIRAEIFLWRTLLLQRKAGSQHEVIIERGDSNATEINSRIFELESRLRSNPSMLEIIESIDGV